MENNIRELRTARGLTQTELAEATGINRRHLQKLELGQLDIERVMLKTLLALSDALNVPLEALFERDPASIKQPAPTKET